MEEVSGKSEPDANNEAGGEDNGERRKFRRLPRAVCVLPIPSDSEAGCLRSLVQRVSEEKS